MHRPTPSPPVRAAHHTTTTGLSGFIQEHRKKIIDEWIEFARTLHPWSEDMTKQGLRDHAEELLDTIASDMKSHQSGHKQAEKSKGRGDGGLLSGIGKKHAIDRLESGLKLDQLVSEYRALRASVLKLWEESHEDREDEVTRFNEAIDETLAASAAWYSDKVAQTREQFLAVLGHDLRNPLASIVMGAQLLTRSSTLDVRSLGVATRIFNSGDRMTRMVNDLLDLTRTRLGAGIPVTLAPMDLAPMCRQVIAELQQTHPYCEVRFEPKGDLTGEWDADRLAQVVSNLVANALQHGREDSTVTVVAQAHGEEVVLRVHNDGRPIAQDAIKHVFEPMLRQESEGVDRNLTGMGMGLYIAREVVTAHTGTIEVTSTDAAGTTFLVRLPRRPPKKRARTEVLHEPSR